MKTMKLIGILMPILIFLIGGLVFIYSAIGRQLSALDFVCDYITTLYAIYCFGNTMMKFRNWFLSHIK